MSYMNYPRLTFSGKFQADTSTVNNDPRHFDINEFESRFQDLQVTNKPEKGDIQFNGWWDPNGMATFRLVDCKPELFLGPGWTSINNPQLKALEVGNSPDQPSAKIVDLDPDWQLASQIYGQVVTLTDPKSGEILMSGNFDVHAFRDLWFTRVVGGSGDGAASAVFQSVLTNLSWSPNINNYTFLQELQNSAQEDMLSIRLTTYGFNGSHGSNGYTYGTVQGVIGPYSSGEPHSFINGRRFAPLSNGYSSIDPNLQQPSKSSPVGISNFSFIVNEETKTLQVDTSNALPLDINMNNVSLSNYYFVVLKREGFAEAQTIPSDEYVEIGEIDYSDALRIQGGIQSLKIPAKAMALIGNHPVALIKKGSADDVVIICEEPEGLTLRAEKFTFRLDPNLQSENSGITTFYASKYGKPFVGACIEIIPNAPWRDFGGCPSDVPDTTTPKAAIPILNVPESGVQIPSLLTVTGNDGTASVVLQGPAMMDNPRGYIDGQLYSLSYNFTGGVQTILQQFDGIFILVFNTFVSANNPPSWEDIQPILKQYANLYPIMSKGLYDFSQQKVADANADSMLFAFSKEVDDPGYMPVTRDLSSAKKKALITYFEEVIKNRKDKGCDTHSRFAGRCPMHGGKGLVTEKSDVTEKVTVAYGKSRPK